MRHHDINASAFFAQVAEGARGLEGAVCNVVDMAEVATDHLENMLNGNTLQNGYIMLTDEQRSTAMFCLYHLTEMLRDLKKAYFAAIEVGGSADG